MPRADRVIIDVPASALTDEQREVAILIGEGSTNQQIAERLGLERRTVSDHVARILWRLGATDRLQIAAWVARKGLLQSLE